MKKLLFFVLFLKTLFLYSIDLNLPVSAAHNALNNLTLITPSISSTAINAASNYQGFETSITYLYNMKDLPFYNIHFGKQVGKFGLHIGSSHLEHELYRENVSYLAANYCWDQFTIGFSIRNLYNKVTNFTEDSVLILDSGLIWRNNNFATAISLKNITQTKFLQTDLPIFYLWEISYDLCEKGKIALGLEKQKIHDFSGKLGCEYALIQNFHLLSSYQYNPNRIGLGINISLLNSHVTYSVRTHQYLDLTHYISLKYSW